MGVCVGAMHTSLGIVLLNSEPAGLAGVLDSLRGVLGSPVVAVLEVQTVCSQLAVSPLTATQLVEHLPFACLFRLRLPRQSSQ